MIEPLLEVHVRGFQSTALCRDADELMVSAVGQALKHIEFSMSTSFLHVWLQMPDVPMPDARWHLVSHSRQFNLDGLMSSHRTRCEYRSPYRGSVILGRSSRSCFFRSSACLNISPRPKAGGVEFNELIEHNFGADSAGMGTEPPHRVCRDRRQNQPSKQVIAEDPIGVAGSPEGRAGVLSACLSA